MVNKSPWISKLTTVSNYFSIRTPVRSLNGIAIIKGGREGGRERESERVREREGEGERDIGGRERERGVLQWFYAQ